MQQNDEVAMFPYVCIYKGEKKFLVWQSDERGRDGFRLESNKALISAKTSNGLKELLDSKDIRINWEGYFEINFDKFLCSLNSLRAGRSSSKNTCSILLEGWNFIEDLARTFDLHQELNKLHSTSLKKIYDKLFYGNNLPSITPTGKAYSPVWVSEEIYLFRREILSLWKVLEPKLLL